MIEIITVMHFTKLFDNKLEFCYQKQRKNVRLEHYRFPFQKCFIIFLINFLELVRISNIINLKSYFIIKEINTNSY